MAGNAALPTTLTAKPDGTASVKLGNLREQALAWKEDGGKVTLGESAGGSAGTGKPGTVTLKPGTEQVGTLSSDKKTLTINWKIRNVTATATLTKQPDAK